MTDDPRPVVVAHLIDAMVNAASSAGAAAAWADRSAWSTRAECDAAVAEVRAALDVWRASVDWVADAELDRWAVAVSDAASSPVPGSPRGCPVDSGQGGPAGILSVSLAAPSITGRIRWPRSLAAVSAPRRRAPPKHA